MSRRTQIADAVAQILQSDSGPTGPFARTFTVARKYVPAVALSDLQTAGMLVTVVPLGPEKRTVFTRALTRKDFALEVGVQARLTQACDPEAAGPSAELDALMLFTEQLAATFEPGAANAEPLGITGAKWTESDIDPPYDPHHLRELRVFTARVILHFSYV